ncbi:ras-related protein Rab-33B-like [Gadus chalcogrammus]|uniref:ras-related protein Rab-33B-like n=1 Tax=Gadus chalcogrammus TaxID=1042646 RepID=UPI0024C24105|nr:ras-related protein Rab-33B-like [Gadus chalcogrammus]XP_056442986.1 ras-related protein Rab-33B-like [Gadus chalcogrammus]
MESSLEFSNSFSGASSSLPARSRTFKVIVIGDSGVGKTCLTHRFCAGEFPSRPDATIGVDFRERIVDIDGERVKLQMWDTAGQERFRKSMVQHYYRNVHAVLFVYDVTYPASFRGLPAWVEECRQNSLGQDIPRFLVGSKVDLRTPGGASQVSREQALRFSQTHNMTLFETSAKNPLASSCSAGGRGPGRGRAPEEPFHQDTVESIVTAVGARLRRNRRLPEQLHSKGGNSSFKIPADKKPLEKGHWACTC